MWEDVLKRFLRELVRQKTRCARLEVFGHAHSHSCSAGWDTACKTTVSFAPGLFFLLLFWKERVLKHIKGNNRDYIGGWNLFLHYTLYSSKLSEKTRMKFFSDQETGNALRITAVNVILNDFYFDGGWVGRGSDIPCPSVSTTKDTEVIYEVRRLLGSHFCGLRLVIDSPSVWGL